jgi:ketosteroid isomerase-like protein
MSSANVELVRSIYAAWERGDFTSAAWAHPQIEFVIADGPSPGRWKGLAETAEGFRSNLIGWNDYRTEAEEYRELDDERVLVLTRGTAGGKAGGRVVGQMRAKGAALYHVSAGKVTRLVYYWNRDRAFADLEPAPEPDAADTQS